MTNPDRVAFTLFGKDVYWYGLLIATGILLAIFLATKESRRKKLPKDTIIDLALIAIPLGVIGARLYYVLCELDRYLDNPISMLYVWEGGLAIYGAVIGGLIGIVGYVLVKKVSILKILDSIAPGLVLAQAIGRWGNFFNQEAFGLPVGEELGFPLAVKIDIPHTFNGVECTAPYHLATFFYESMWCLLIFIIIWALRKKFKHDGDALLTYGLLYSFERAIVEGLRGDSLYIGNTGIRISQLLSAVMFAAILVFLIVRTVREKKTGALMWPKPVQTKAVPTKKTADAVDCSSESEQTAKQSDKTDKTAVNENSQEKEDVKKDD